MRAFYLAAAMVSIVSLGCSRPMYAPTDQDPWVIRTDFSSDSDWKKICELIAAPQKDHGMKFYAYVRYVSDEKFREKQPREVVVTLPDDYPGMFCFIVDRQCIENPEHPVLVVGFYPSDGKSFDRKPRDTPASDVVTFRALPSQVQGIQNNLSIANMDFEDFANSADKDGVFRGFSR